MSPLIIGIVIALVVGIIYLSGDSGKKDDVLRMKHLEGLVKHLDAQMEAIPGRSNSYAVRFEYRDVPFLYEDIEDSLFDKVVYRAFLRLTLPVNFNVVFTEELKSKFRSVPTALAEAGASQGTNQIDSPKGFKEFSLFSNKPNLAQELFGDDAVLRIFSKYKTKDARGKPEMSLEIVDGVLTMKFYPLGHQLEPTVFDLRNNVSVIENYLEDMLVVYRQISKIAEKA